MSLPSVNPTQTHAWKALTAHFAEMKDVKMQDLFSENPLRATQLQIQWKDFYIDFSKNRISKKTLDLLFDLAREVKLKEAIEMQFAGSKINETEDRAVLHTALRDFKDMKPEVKENLQKMKAFSEEIISGNYKGFSGKSITDIVNIGIGGSHLGPEMVTEALSFYKNHLKIHYVSNVDGDQVLDTLKKLNPETTLCIVVSKSFGTQETIANAKTIKDWFLEKTSKTAIPTHFVAVSSNKSAVMEFGISEDKIFQMQDWVGGRLSLWGAVGLSICCSIGYSAFENLLKGAEEMDRHFKETAFEQNIPVVLALLSVWYNNFFNSESEAVVPYSQYLHKLVPYLQQAIMESNGKNTDRSGNPISYQTGTLVWGSTGSNAQHAYFQLMHQGTKLIPTDFIGFSESLHGNSKHHHILMSTFFAQTEALMEGTFGCTVENPFKVFEGNKPSNTILIKKLTPKNLGSLIAIYEHKLFVQGIVWNIFSFDQWGVELGKRIAANTLKAIETGDNSQLQNPSTKQLLKINQS